MAGLIPNLLTLCNLSCGWVACLLVAQGETGLPWIVAALLMDFLDGTAARLLQATSELGKQLDSLADMVSFGALPGLIWYQILSDALPANWWLAIGLAVLTPMLSAVRLARFNLDTLQNQSFIGLPTPAHTLFVCIVSVTPQSPWLLVAEAAVVPWLMVLPLHFMSLKFKDLKKNQLFIKIAFILSCLILWIALGQSALWLCAVLYVFFSAVEYGLNQHQQKKQTTDHE